MLSFAGIILLILSALFPSTRLDGALVDQRLHLVLAPQRQEAFQVHIECGYPGFIVDGKVTMKGETKMPEGSLSDVKVRPEPKDKLDFPVAKLKLDEHFRPGTLETKTPWIDLVSLLGGLPSSDLAIGKELPYQWVTEGYPVKGNVVFKGEVGNDLLLVAIGKTKIGQLNFDVKHELRFPKGGGPVREILVEMNDPQGMRMKWSARRIS